jgi:hypothetical protein
VAASTKAGVCGRSLAGTASSNSARGMDDCLVIVACCQVEVSATVRSLVQRVLPNVVRVSLTVMKGAVTCTNTARG